MNEQALTTPDTYSYLLLAINAAIHLQAMVLKQYKMSRRESQKLRTFEKIPGAKSPTTELRLAEELRTRRQWLMEEELQSFMAEDFYKVLRESALIPDRHTYEVLLCSAYTLVDVAFLPHSAALLLPRSIYLVHFSFPPSFPVFLSLSLIVNIHSLAPSL